MLKDEDKTEVQGIQPADKINVNDNVRFCGCTSGCTEQEKIVSTSYCSIVQDDRACNGQTFIRHNQILFTPAAMPGDSGSLLINADTKNAVGLVYGRTSTNPRFGIATPIKTVLDVLGVTLVTPN